MHLQLCFSVSMVYTAKGEIPSYKLGMPWFKISPLPWPQHAALSKLLPVRSSLISYVWKKGMSLTYLTVLLKDHKKIMFVKYEYYVALLLKYETIHPVSSCPPRKYEHLLIHPSFCHIWGFFEIAWLVLNFMHWKTEI